MSDWKRWHQEYTDPDSALSQRLDVVVARTREAVRDAPPGEVRLISVCAGQAYDVVRALRGHPRAGDVRALLVELDPDNVAVAREAVAAAGLTDVEVRRDDAARTEVYAEVVPADVLLLCGIFGNVSDDDARATIENASRLCAPGATVIWTRHRRAPDLTPRIRGWLASAGWDELAFDSPGEDVLRGRDAPARRSAAAVRRRPPPVHLPAVTTDDDASGGSGVVVTVEPDRDRPSGFLLTVDGTPQSYVDVDDPTYLLFEYVRRMGHVVDLVGEPGEPLGVVHLGAGALTLARYVAATRPGSRQRAVEVSEEVAAAVRTELPLGRGVKVPVQVADAREALTRMRPGVGGPRGARRLRGCADARAPDVGGDARRGDAGAGAGWRAGGQRRRRAGAGVREGTGRDLPGRVRRGRRDGRACRVEGAPVRQPGARGVRGAAAGRRPVPPVRGGPGAGAERCRGPSSPGSWAERRWSPTARAVASPVPPADLFGTQRRRSRNLEG